jgi:hypothetical protein
VRLKLVNDVLSVPACGGHVYMLVMDDSKTLGYCHLIVFYKILRWAGQCEMMMVLWDAGLPNTPRESHTQRTTEALVDTVQTTSQ